MSEILLLSNPSRRRKHKRKSAHRSRRRRHAARRAHRRSRRSVVRVRARRNPVSLRGITGSVVPTVKAGAIGALGGIGNDLLYGFGKQYLPAMLQSGYGRSATKILSAVLVGMVGNMVLRGKGTQLAIGAATCAIHEAAKDFLSTQVPSLPLGEMDEPLSDYMQDGAIGYTASAEPVGAYMHGMGGFGAYVGGDE